MYRLELHCHTSEVSACSTCPAETLIARYRAAGYSGVVSTNHINLGTYQKREELSWADKADYFLYGYEALKAAAGADFDVLLGCEINLTPADWPAYLPNDYLIYGVTPQWLRDTGDMRKMTLEELSCAARDAGMLIVHAHPFRVGTLMMDPGLLDGYEVFNGNLRHNSHNNLANALADLEHKIKTSGSDFHHPDDPPCGGILTRKRIQSNEALLAVLRSGEYQLIEND